MAGRFLVLSGLTILGVVVFACEATTYTVGGLAGWDTSADLSSWPANKHFYVGDALLFQYSQYHTVNQVNKNGYRNCNASNSMLTSSNGNTSVPLTTAGEKYFICGVLSHCLGGMKLQINVRSNVTAAPPPSRPSPPSRPQELSPATNSTPPEGPPLAYLDDGLLPLGNGSLRGLRMCHLFMVFCCYIGALVCVLF